VRETISEISKGTTRGATQEHHDTERQAIMRVLRETKGRVGGADGAAAYGNQSDYTAFSNQEVWH